MRPFLFVTLTVFGFLASAMPDARAAEDNKASAKADAWLGHDASELLTQLRVDGGRVQIAENDETGETSYTWSTWNEAYTEQVVVGSEQHIIGMTPAAGGVAATPIFQTTEYTEPVHHAATNRCDVTFYANLEGIISRWSYNGPQCRFDIVKPKR